MLLPAGHQRRRKIRTSHIGQLHLILTYATKLIRKDSVLTGKVFFLVSNVVETGIFFQGEHKPSYLNTAGGNTKTSGRSTRQRYIPSCLNDVAVIKDTCGYAWFKLHVTFVVSVNLLIYIFLFRKGKEKHMLMCIAGKFVPICALWCK